MASLADKNLDQKYQDEINRVTALAQSGQMSWADANKIANEQRRLGGANYEVSAKGTTQYDDDKSTISSYASGSVASGGKAKDYLDSWNSSPVSTNVKDYNASNSVDVDKSPRPNLAGKSVKQGQFTVTYNENGYFAGAVRDGGASATHSVGTTHANDSAWHQAAYQAAQMGDWDLVGHYLNQITNSMPADKHGNADGTAAWLYQQELENQFGHDDKAYYDKLYDQAYGQGSAAAFDATGGAIKTYAALVDALGADKAQQLAAQYAVGGAPSSTYNYSSLTAIPGFSTSNGQYGYGGIDDMTQYLENMFAQNLEAELSALANAYNKNVAELESQNDRIAEQYRAARNQAAAQNALETQAMNERALATGLNTGTSGQIALAQNMAYQGNLGNLWAQEAQQQAESDRMMAQMLNDYNASVNQTTAAINAQKAQAIYNELIRQQELAMAQAAAQREQEWMEREWAYQIEQDALDREIQLMKMAQSAQNSGGSNRSGAQNFDALYSAALNSGYPEAFISNNYKAYGFNNSSGLYDGYEDWSDINGKVQVAPQQAYSVIADNSASGVYGPNYNVVLNLLQSQQHRGATVAELGDTISKALKNGNITEAGADTLLSALGY